MANTTEKDPTMETTHLRVLASGTVVAVDNATGRVAYRVTETFPCSWLIEVSAEALFNQWLAEEDFSDWPEDEPLPAFEPDFPSDLVKIVECGSPTEMFADGSHRCVSGHEHAPLGSLRALELEEIADARYDALTGVGGRW